MRAGSLKVVAICGRAVGAAVLVSVLIGPIHVLADEASETKAADILDKYIEVTGGKAAYDAIKNRVVKAKVTIPANGLEAKMEIYAVQPKKLLTVIEIAGGEISRGMNGDVVWMRAPGVGVSVLKGAARVSMIRDGTQDLFAMWRELFSKADCVGEETANGKNCAEIVLTLKPIDPEVKEAPITVFVDLETNLVAKWETEMTGPDGSSMKVVSLLGNYKTVSGIKIPHDVTVLARGVEQKVEIESIECNVEIPDDKFQLPKDVAAAIDEE